MKRRSALLGAGAALVSRAARGAAPCAREAGVTTGLGVLQAEDWARLRGRKIGLVAHPASVDRSLRHIADLLHEAPGLTLAAIFGPEHGFRGSAAAGSSERRSVDPRTGVTVFDIYAAPPEKLAALFAAAGIDLLLFDVQDVGARFYTYISTLFDVMTGCARIGLPVMVLDRPNPIGGLSPSGPMLDPRFSSFIGRVPLPIRHGLTIGEAALYFNRYHLPKKAGLTVLRMRGWTRDLFFDQTGLPWVPPSPNMPDPETAVVYPGTCLFEGTVLSVGRGTAEPFLYLGGPEVDGGKWADTLRLSALSGVLFRECWFTPSGFADAGQVVHGVNLAVTDRRVFDPVLTALVMLSAARRLAQGPFWRGNGRNFDLLAGSDALRRAIDAGEPPERIAASWREGLTAFAKRREAVLLYPA